jgi:hypothetical protein
MRRWFYDGLREPEVTVSAVTGSRFVQVIDAAMIIRFARVEVVPVLPCATGFALAGEFRFGRLQLACAESRAPHGARVD